MHANSRSEPPAEFQRFLQWLPGNWGNPNFLTRARVPRIVTNLATYILSPVVIFWITLRYLPPQDLKAARLFLHSPFVLASYGTFYLSLLSEHYIAFPFDLGKKTREQAREAIKTSRNNLFVRLRWISAVASMVLLLIGCVYFGYQTHGK
jgi:cbb3-type cytochrome oxidase subunit 3